MFFNLPVFFTTMLLMNGANKTWLMSAMAAVLLTVLLFDAVNAVLVSVIGSLVGIVIYWGLSHTLKLPPYYLAAVPIYAFTLAAIWFLSYSEGRIAAEKLRAAHILASSIAHEMRTPLLGIRFDSEAILNLVPAHVPPGPPAQRMTMALNRIIEHTEASNLVINLLLTNLAHAHSQNVPTSPLRMSAVVNAAIARFHFKPGERARLSVDVSQDFVFCGSELLMTHVFFNLLKNAFRAIEAKGGTGSVAIALRQAEGSNQAIVSDTAGGIPDELLPFLFLPFGKAKFNNESAGIGLSFCMRVVESFGGRLTVSTKAGHGSQFTICLPPFDAAGAAAHAARLPEAPALPLPQAAASP